MNLNNVLRWLVVSCLLVLVACATTTGSQQAPKINPQAQAVAAYRIGVDDEVKVSVWQNPGLDVSVPVRPDGRISVPLVGDVEAGGRTPEEVSGEIQEKLKTFVRDPQVTVIVTQLRSHEYLSRVRVTGAVHSPVSVPYRQGMTVLDAVLAAGGTTEFAAADRTELYRKEGDRTTAYAVRLDRILKNGELTTNYPVQPGDVITVPERTF
jgi:polysaccharide export outer membrane protein